MKFITESYGIAAVMKNAAGKDTRIRLQTNDMAEAKLTAERMGLYEVEAAAKAGIITRDLIRKITANGKMTITQAIEEWRKWLRNTCESAHGAANMVTYAKSFASTNGRRSELSTVNECHIDNWVNAKDGTKRSTRAFRLASIRSLYRFLMAKGYVDSNPAMLVKVRSKDLSHDQKETRKKSCFTPDEYARLLLHMSLKIDELKESKQPGAAIKLRWLRFWYPATIIGRHTGLRIGDIAALEWESIKEDTLTVWTDKRNTRVEIRVTEEIRDGLMSIQPNKNQKCFPIPAAIESDPARRAQLPNQFARLLKAAGIQGHWFHELRATRATEMASEGHSTGEIAKELGHTSTTTTEGYIVKATEQTAA